MQILTNLKNWLHKDNNALKTAIVSLIALGTLVIYFTSQYYAMRSGLPAEWLFNKYLLFAIVGLGFLVFSSMLNKKWILRISTVWLILGLLFILLTFWNPYIVKGTTRYVSLFGFVFNPFILTLPAYIVMMSHWTSKEWTKKKRIWISILASVLTLFIWFAAFRSPDVFVSTIYMLLFILMVIRARKNMPELFKVAIAMTVGIIAMITYTVLLIPYVHTRLTEGLSYPSIQSLKTIASSSIIGTNAEALQNLKGVVLPDSDYAFTSIVALFGYCAGAILLAVYGFIGKRLISNAKTAKDGFYKQINTGTLGVFVICLLFSLTTAFGLLPKSSSLPFMSFSLMWLLVFCMLFGFVFSESKNKR